MTRSLLSAIIQNFIDGFYEYRLGLQSVKV